MFNFIFFINPENFLNIIIFGVFFLILIISIFMIFIQNTIHAVFLFMSICLLLTQLTIILNMEFLALNFIIIYLGAICILILFQVKLVKLFYEDDYKTAISNLYIISCIVLFLFLPIIQGITIIMRNLKHNDYYKSNYDSLSYFSWIDSLNTISTLQNIAFIFIMKNIFI